MLQQINPERINIINTGKKIDKIEIYNQAGQVLIQKSKDFDRINVSELASGVYFMKVVMGEDVGVGKVVVER